MSTAQNVLPDAAATTSKLPASHRPLLEVEVSVVSDSNFYAGLSGDAAEGGLFYATYAQLLVGMDVEIDLQLPGHGASMYVAGRVAWIREHSDDEPRGVGIAFIDLTDAARAKIRAFTALRPPLYCDEQIING